MRIVTVGYQELISLKAYVNELLKSLLRRSEKQDLERVVFHWKAYKSGGVGKKLMEAPIAEMVSADGSTNGFVQGPEAPSGVSIVDWTHLIREEFESHLLSGSAFDFDGYAGTDEEGWIGLHLKRRSSSTS